MVVQRCTACLILFLSFDCSLTQMKPCVSCCKAVHVCYDVRSMRVFPCSCISLVLRIGTEIAGLRGRLSRLWRFVHNENDKRCGFLGEQRHDKELFAAPWQLVGDWTHRSECQLKDTATAHKCRNGRRAKLCNVWFYTYRYTQFP